MAWVVELSSSVLALKMVASILARIHEFPNLHVTQALNEEAQIKTTTALDVERADGKNPERVAWNPHADQE